MVERLKSAIEKARAQRTGYAGAGPGAATAAAAAQAQPTPAPAPQVETAPETTPKAAPGADLSDWSIFPELNLDRRRLARERVVSHDKSDPAYRAFDMLRTRAMRTMREKNWNRIGVTSPTKGVGKTVVCANLAFSLARQPATKVLLLDLDLAAPRLAEVFCKETDASIEDFLSGAVAPEEYLLRHNDNLLVGLNKGKVAHSAELLHSGKAAEVIADVIERAQPTIVICDLSPVMVSDDALNVLANVDCALLVTAAGETLANEVLESEKLIAEWTTLLGIVLNKSEEKNRDLYGY